MVDRLPNKALHLTAVPLRSIAAGELGLLERKDVDGRYYLRNPKAYKDVPRNVY